MHIIMADSMKAKLDEFLYNLPMEKSMIQDLRNSGALPNMKSTFTTSFHDNNADLRRSKISNLPSYKKSDLSDRLPFVVVFQTIEIERLSEEIETLRVELKDCQRQAFNCQSYEVQIRELTDQCYNYDQELSEYKEEVEKLNQIAQQLYDELEAWKEKYGNLDPMISQKYQAKFDECQALQEELEKWKHRYKALEVSKDQELQDMKLAMESQRQSMLDRQIRELSIKFEAERGHLENQIRKLQDLNEGKEQTITSLNYQIQALKIENQTNQEANYRLKQNQNKLNHLTDENIQLNQVLRKKQQHIESLEADENYLRRMLAEHERQNREIASELTKIPGLENELRESNTKFSRLEKDYVEAVQLTNSIPALQSNLKTAQIENQRLGNLIKQKLSDIQDRDRQIHRCRSIIQESRKNQQVIPILERKMVELKYEQDRMHEQLKARLSQIEKGKTTINTLQKALKQHEDGEPERRRLQESYKRQLKQLDSRQKEIEQMQSQLSQIPSLEMALQNERNEKKQYQGEITRLNKAIKEQVEKTDQYTNKCSHLTKQIEKLGSLQRELDTYKNQNNRMTQELDKLAGNIKAKCLQLNQLKSFVNKINEDLGKYKQVEQKLAASLENTNRIIQELNHTKQSLETCENRLLQAEFGLRQAKANILQINQEKQLIMKNLKLKTQQHEAALQQNRELQKRNKEMEAKLRKAKEQNERAIQKLQASEQNLKSERSKVKELAYRCQELEKSIEKMKIKGVFPTEFQNGFNRVKQNCASTDQNIKKMKRKQSQLEKVIANISAILNKCSQKHEKNGSGFELLSEKINKSFGYIDRIAQLEEENNCLKSENCELESELKIMSIEISQLENRRKSGQISEFSIAPSMLHVSTRKTFQSVHEDRERYISRVENEHNSSQLTFENRSLGGTSRAIDSGAKTFNYNDFKSKFQHPPRSSSRSIRTKITSVREPLGESKYSYRG